MKVSWDIFCSVVDYYGDIGVTWRLARQLAAELTDDKYHNATIYTAWSHGYLPELINTVAAKATGKTMSLTEDWADNDFDSLYVLTLTWHNGNATLVSRVDHQGLNNGAKACPT